MTGQRGRSGHQPDTWYLCRDQCSAHSRRTGAGCRHMGATDMKRADCAVSTDENGCSGRCRHFFRSFASCVIE